MDSMLTADGDGVHIVVDVLMSQVLLEIMVEKTSQIILTHI